MWLVKRLRENRDLDLSILLIKNTGLWPLQPDSQKSTLDRLRDVGTVFTLVFATLGCTVFHPLGALMSRNDLIEVCECIGIGCLELLASAKLGCFLYREKKIEDLTSRIVRSTRREMVIQSSGERQKIVTSIQKWINVFVAMTVFVTFQVELGFSALVPLMVAKRKHFGRIWFPIDPYSSPTYEIVLVLYVITLVIAVVVSNCMDGLLAATLMQLVGQFRLLRHDIARIREDAVENVRRRREQQDTEACLLGDENLTVSHESSTVETLARKVLELDVVHFEKDVADEMARLLRDCVHRYSENIRFVREVEALFAPFLDSLIVVCVVSLLSAILFAGMDPAASEDIADAAEKEKRQAEHFNFVMQYMAVVGALYLELGVCCYLTDLITAESELVRDSVYACDWLAATESFKKSMRIVMARANQPVFVRTSAFVPLTHETFLRITNLAFSYFTALTTAVHGDKYTKSCVT